jgi:hypothetical protein
MVISTDRESPFFITRQSANILEDMSRLVQDAGSICLVYGREGVGKTTLLHHFLVRRQGHRKFRFLSLTADGQCVARFQDVSDDVCPFTLSTLNELARDELLVIDDFHFASSHDKQQLLAYWGADARAKNQNLVICGDDSVITELHNLPIKISTRINSVALAPLNVDESLYYLSSRLFNNSGQGIVVSRHQRKQVKRAAGRFLQLDQLIEQFRNQIACVDMERVDPSGRHYWAYLVVLLAVFGIGLVQWQAGSIEQSSAKSGVPVRIESPPPASFGQAISRGDAEQDKVPNLVPESAAETAVDLRAQDSSAPIHKTGAPEPSPVSQKVSAAVSPQAQQPEQMQTTADEKPVRFPLLKSRMLATSEWLQSRSAVTASIQIMTLASGPDPEAALAHYLAMLRDRGIDTNRVYVYLTQRKGVDRYGVLFGEFEDRGTAFAAIDGLPAVLKVNGPIPRTVRGLRQEIGG